MVKLAPSPNAIILPTRITAIRATHSGNNNIIKWSTATEDEGDYFVLQRSSDGRSFQNMEMIKGKPSGNYQFTDNAPLPGTNYYRIAIMLKSGTNHYSTIVTAGSANQPTAISFYPNPTTEKLHVNGPSLVSNATIQITDIAGRLRQTVIVQSLPTVIHTKNLAAVVYFLVYSTANDRTVKRFIVTK